MSRTRRSPCYHQSPALYVILVAFSAVFAISPCWGQSSQRQDPIAWRPVSDDLEYADVRFPRGLLPSQMHIFRSSLKNLKVGVVRSIEFGARRSTVAEMVRRSRAVVGINANFFDEQGNPLGLVMSRGTLHQKLHRGGETLTGIFFATRNTIRIVNRVSFQERAALEAIQAGPRLLSDSERVAGLKGTLSFSRRTGACVDNLGRLVLFLVNPGLGGLSSAELQDILLHDEIACVDALNLDGGGSAQLYARDLSLEPGSKEFSIQGSDQVPVILALLPRE